MSSKNFRVITGTKKRLFAYSIMLLAVVGALSDLIGSWSLKDILAPYVAYIGKDGGISLHGYIYISLLLILPLAFILATFLIGLRSEFVRFGIRAAKRTRKKSNNDAKTFRSLYQQQMDNIELFLSSDSQNRHRSTHNLVSVNIEAEINENYDAQYREEITIQAADDYCSFWKYQIFAESTAEPAKSFYDIDFRAIVNGRESSIVVLKDDALIKHIAVMFIPPLKKGEIATIRASYRWNGFYRNLKLYGSEPCYWLSESQSASTMGSFRASYTFSKKIGTVGCKIIRTFSPTNNKALQQSTDKNSTNWTLDLKNVDLGRGKEVEIRFST